MYNTENNLEVLLILHHKKKHQKTCMTNLTKTILYVDCCKKTICA